MSKIFLFFLPAFLFSQADFNNTFTGKTLRLDMYHTGNADGAVYSLADIYRLGEWYGPRQNLCEPFANGKYRLCFVSNGDTLYLSYFNTLFGEWQTTAAAKTKHNTIAETIYLPEPFGEGHISIAEREMRSGKWQNVFSLELNGDVLINDEYLSRSHQAAALGTTGPLAQRVDIAVVAEGYQASEKEKFTADARRLLAALFSTKPFLGHREDFNIWLVAASSPESGADNPARGIFVETAAGASYYTFASQRYLMTVATHRLHNLLINVPHDQIYILVNSDEYGGGAILNYYSVSSVDDPHSDFVFIHEFGHGFAGLADEYYSSSTGYDEFYLPGVEPTEPNITAHPQSGQLKWVDLVAEGIPLPTPWNKQIYDSTQMAYARQIQAAETPSAKNSLRQDRDRWQARFFADLPFGESVGAYEGAGYQSRGLYRPSPNCIMITRGYESFCPVCQRAISGRILWYSDRSEPTTTSP
jgi:hypothetical protein